MAQPHITIFLHQLVNTLIGIASHKENIAMENLHSNEHLSSQFVEAYSENHKQTEASVNVSVEIPKVIHYCWFGRGELPEMAKMCIASWQKYLPDYEIKEWNEDNFDVNIIPYTKEAYEEHKYAFVSDYARFWILYHYGGLYFDTDVEVIRPMEHIIRRGPFMGCEGEASKATAGADDVKTSAPAVAPGLGLGCNPGLGLYAEILDFYSHLHFKQSDGTLNLIAVVKYTTDILCRHGLKATSDIQQCAGVYIYPVDYFCPKSVKDFKLRITDNTVSIHHYSGTWLPWYSKVVEFFMPLRGRFPKFTYYAIYLPLFEIDKYATKVMTFLRKQNIK